MGADILAENTSNTQEFWISIKERLHLAVVVRAIRYLCKIWLAKILSTNANLCGMLEQLSESCI